MERFARRLSFRLPAELADWVEGESRKVGLGPCEFVRNMIAGQKRAEDMLGGGFRCREGEEMIQCRNSLAR